MELKEEIKKFFGCCFLCGSKNKRLSIDHVFPKNLGGISDVLNYLVLCKDCNTQKSDTPLLEWKNNVDPLSNDKVLNEIVNFSMDIHKGLYPIQELNSMKCFKCNTNTHLIPAYHRSFIESHQDVFMHRSYEEEQVRNCVADSKKKNIRIFNSKFKNKPGYVFDANKLSKQEVLQGHFTDLSREKLEDQTEVVLIDKFFVKNFGDCVCEIVVLSDLSKKYYVFQDRLSKTERFITL